MLRDRLIVQQRQLRQEGASEVEIAFLLGASGVNPRFPGDRLCMLEAIGDGSQAIPCDHQRVCACAEFVRHWDSQNNNGFETSLDQILDRRPDFLASIADQLEIFDESNRQDDEDD